MNFWQKLKKPISLLAPMDGVTDTVFRQIVVSAGKPDVLFTEFVPVDGLVSKGYERILASLKYTEAERPLVVQIWGAIPENFYKVAQMLSKLGFDGIDINMGCPDESVIKKGAGSALINNPKLAVEIIEATIKGANGLPVSVKTRIGFDTIDIESWVTTLLQTPISALTLHLRTKLEMSKASARWEQISKAVKIRKKLKSKALIIGNGDIKSLQQARKMVKKYGIDGVMIGEGIFKNVWLFNEKVDIKKATPQKKIKLLVKHLRLFRKTWGNKKHFELMKKFVKCYVSNFNGAFASREKLMATKSLDELIQSSTLLTKSTTSWAQPHDRVKPAPP
ncbi:tRNA-dihydrouridine synthase [Candidatus Daviesbacteria bacterium]|nr:tRNA-dihydrouridine synthase [Candidatus Daviesbacteria bacterium]